MLFFLRMIEDFFAIFIFFLRNVSESMNYNFFLLKELSNYFWIIMSLLCRRFLNLEIFCEIYVQQDRFFFSI